MKHLFTTLSILTLIVGCQQNENVSNLEPDYATLLHEVEKIRNQAGFIPLELISDDFSITDIDFSNHQGIKNTGVKDLSLSIDDDFILVQIKSDLSGFNNSSIKVEPLVDGFTVQLQKQNDEMYKVDYESSGSNHSFSHTSTNGRTEVFKRNSERLELEYYHEVNIAFKVANHILFGIRELYFQELANKLSTISTTDTNTNSRTSSSQPCEYYPSVYTVATGHGYVTELLVKGEANAECSNQYCIGCCHLNTETECLLGCCTWCIVRGHGHVCTGFPDGGYYGDCVANSPCLVDSPT